MAEEVGEVEEEGVEVEDVEEVGEKKVKKVKEKTFIGPTVRKFTKLQQRKSRKKLHSAGKSRILLKNVY